MIRLFFSAVIAFAAIFVSPPSHAREWTQAATGKSVEAEFVNAIDGIVTLRLPTGREARIPVNALVAEDQVVIAELTLSAESGGLDAWPQWRGPNRNGISDSKNLRKNWAVDGPPERAWVYENAGIGYSSFCIANGRLYSLGSRDFKLFAFALNLATGEEIWATQIAIDDPEEKNYNTAWGRGPRSAPSFSAGMLYTLCPLGDLVALDAETGEIKWQKHLMDDFEGRRPSWGYSETPLIDGEKLIVSAGTDINGGTILALDKRTGRLLWHSKGLAERFDNVQYSSIQPATIHETRQYIQLFSNSLLGLDADSGERLWTAEWSRGKAVVIPTPVVDGNRVYVTSGNGAGAMLVEILPNWETRKIWHNTVMKNHHGGVVKVGSHIYGFSEGGGLIAQNFSTGKLAWFKKSQTLRKGPIVVADGMIYAQNEADGTISLVEANPSQFVSHGSFVMEPQSSNRNSHGAIWTHPVIASGRLFVRDQEFIVCYNLKSP